MKPLIFCIEGIDCIGKSTLSKKLKNVMTNSKVKVIHFPRYDTEIGGKIKELLHSTKCTEDDKLQYYYLSDQMNFTEEYNNGEYNDYDILILDRFFLSTSAYSIASDVNVFNNIYALHQEAFKNNKLLNPSYTILITLNDDMDVSIFKDRLNKKTNKDFFEKYDFLLKVNSSYKTITNLYDDTTYIKYSLFDVNNMSEDRLYEIFI